MNFKILILSALFSFLMPNIMSAQLIKLEQFAELTNHDTVIKLKSYVIVENDFIYIRAGDSFFLLKEVRRKRKLRDGAVDYFLKDKSSVRVYFKNDGSVCCLFAYHQNRVLYFDNRK